VIVISAVLVVVGAALLIAGLVSSGLVLIYVALGVTVVAALLLLLGVRDGGRLALRSGTSTDPGDAVQAPAPAADPTAPVGTSAPVPAGDSAGTVVVVSGRPRYHATGCRFLTGRDEAEDISVEEARELGFTPCGACKPDDHLVAPAVVTAAPTETAVFPAVAGTPEPVVGDADSGVTVIPAGPDLTKPATARTARTAPAKRTTATTSGATRAPARSGATKAAATRTPVKKVVPAKVTAPASSASAPVVPAATGETPSAPAKKVAATRATKAPAKATAARKLATSSSPAVKKTAAKTLATKTTAAKTTAAKAPAKKAAAKKATKSTG
jgi:hypothetical protein